MSTDQDARQGWTPDRGEYASPESVEPETSLAPASPLPPTVDPKDQAVEWMRWMGFTDAERARVGVSLFLFDKQAGTSSNAAQSDLAPPARVNVTEATTSPRVLDGRVLPDRGVLVYPTLVADDRAVAVIGKERQGHLGNRETVRWVRQSWVPLYRIRTDFTSKSGLRGQLRFASTHQLFDSISGQPIAVNPPGGHATLEFAGPAVAPIRCRLPAADVIDETVEIWNEYLGLTDKAAQKRYTAVLAGRGVPAAVAHTINVELDAPVLFPVFIGLLTHASGHRLVAVDSVEGRHQVRLSSAMTLNLRSIQDELERNRLVRLPPAP
jgi:hypothetical protein